MKHYVSSKAETLPMFRNKILDFFSRVHWAIPLIIYIPTVIGLITVSWIIHHAPLLNIISFFIFGLLTWTMAEYILHRFVFHYHSKSRIGKRFFWIMHGVHHDYPADPLRLVMPPIASIPLAVFFYILFFFTLGKINTPSFMGGFLLGYLFYDMCHYAIHHMPIKGSSFWGKMKEYHMRHHFNDPERGFGVSSEFWDIVFGSKFIEKQPSFTATAGGKSKSRTKNFS